MVYFAFELHFDDLAASIVEVGSDDKSFLSTFFTVSHGDNVTRSNFSIIECGHVRFFLVVVVSVWE